jgi:hypothetical protein
MSKAISLTGVFNAPIYHIGVIIGCIALSYMMLDHFLKRIGEVIGEALVEVLTLGLVTFESDNAPIHKEAEFVKRWCFLVLFLAVDYMIQCCAVRGSKLYFCGARPCGSDWSCGKFLVFKLVWDGVLLIGVLIDRLVVFSWALLLGKIILELVVLMTFLCKSCASAQPEQRRQTIANDQLVPQDISLQIVDVQGQTNI